MDIHKFGHEWSSIMYKNTQKNVIKSMEFPYLADTSGISIYKNLCNDTFYESLKTICAAKRKCRSFFNIILKLQGENSSEYSHYFNIFKAKNSDKFIY